MRTNVRIGNDIKLMWQILDGGVPVNLTNATDIKVSIAQGGIPSCNKIEITTFEVTDAVNGMIAVEVQKEVITKIGYLWAVLEYTVPDSGMIDGNRKVTTDNLPVKIVGLTDEASQDSEFTVSSDIQAGFQGKSAYEVWLVENPDKTLQDYFDWLQQPATDIEQVVSSNETVRISSEETRQLNETARVEAEALRGSAETQRISDENTRKSNETARINAESDRVDAEDLRDQAEVAREEAEGLRQTNTNTAIQNAGEATTAANTAAGLAVGATTAANTAAKDANDAAEAANTAAGLANNAATVANTAAGLADTARLAIQDDLASKADQTELDQLESDVEQLAYVKIKNEAVNGNFENGLIAPFFRSDGGGGTSTLTINSSTPISGNYDVRLTITTPSTLNRPVLFGAQKNGNIGDKIYLHFDAKILSGIPTMISISDGAGTPTLYDKDVINGRNTRIIDVAGTDSAGIIYFKSPDVWDMQMDNFMHINLTETFGAGNEPTKVEMDTLINILGSNYFEGELTLSQKQIMNWQLKMIRQNRNAIIALGGTII